MIRTVRGVGYQFALRKSIFGMSIFLRLLRYATRLLAGLRLTNSVRFHFAPDRVDFFSQSLQLQAAEASHAYETGGKAALKEYFARLETHVPRQTRPRRSARYRRPHRQRSQRELKNVGPRWTPGSQRRMLLSWPSQNRNTTW